MNAVKCDGPPANTDTAECGVQHPMLGLSQCLRGPNWSTVLYTCERTQNAVRRLDEIFFTRPALPDDRARIKLE